ncbi:MAG TPA: YcnI family protein [Mycobacteriales bacterium]|nr:YcnI family protein [Mycobacteriales bacterium]
MRSRVLFCVAASAAFVLGTAAAASAHVTVRADDPTPGSYAKLTFRVPTERDDASTTKLSITIPAATPFASVSTQPHPGWSVQTRSAQLKTPIKTAHETVREAVRQVTWTADSPASAIKPGEFDEFALSVGPLPHAASVTLPAVQTYSNGAVVRWIETAAPGAAEPAHPAPHVDLDSPKTVNAAATQPVSSNSSGTATAALVVAIVGLVVAAGGTFLRRRRG